MNTLALGYSNPRKALADHVDDEDKIGGVTIRDSIGREQNPVLINKSGLYGLIFSSKLPGAKKFKRWVTSEVLPAIRRTGTYAPVSEAELLVRLAQANWAQEQRINARQMYYQLDLSGIRLLGQSVRDRSRVMKLEEAWDAIQEVSR
jgi:prophage antirepressor-like protein